MPLALQQSNNSVSPDRKHVPPSPRLSPIHSSAQLQKKSNCACGGSCPYCQADSLQTKLTVSKPGDAAEQQADRVAEHITQPTNSVNEINETPISLQRQSAHQEESSSISPAVGEVLESPGQPLDKTTRSFMEPRLGQDLSNVRIHTDGKAAESAQTVNANAYTVGNHIAFNKSQYAPQTDSGKKLLAHELTHVVQQSNGASQQISRDPIDDDPYAGRDLKELRKLAKTDPEAAEALRLRYRAMSDKELNKYAAYDPMAKSVRNQRATTNNLPKGHGKFSNSVMHDQLSGDIAEARVKSGVERSAPSAADPTITEVEGGTVGAARSDIPGLENEKFVGASPQGGGKSNPYSEFAPATDPKVLPHTHNHAEQRLADQIHEKLQNIPIQARKGKTVWMLIEQEPCPACASGIDNEAAPSGVLKKLSKRYPEVTFEIKNRDGSAIITLRNGKNITPRRKPRVTDGAKKGLAKLLKVLNSKVRRTIPKASGGGGKASGTKPNFSGVLENLKSKPPVNSNAVEPMPETPPPAAKAPTPEKPVDAEVPAAKGGWGPGTVKGGTLVAGSVLAGIGMGWLHQKAQEKRIATQKEENESGYVPYGSHGGVLDRLSDLVMDPGGHGDQSIGVDVRLDMRKWRMYMKRKADEVPIGKTFRTSWQTEETYGGGHFSKIVDKTVIYFKNSDGKWLYLSGDMDGPPDLNLIIDFNNSNDAVMDHLGLPGAYDNRA